MDLIYVQKQYTCECSIEVVVDFRAVGPRCEELDAPSHFSEQVAVDHWHWHTFPANNTLNILYLISGAAAVAVDPIDIRAPLRLYYGLVCMVRERLQRCSIANLKFTQVMFAGRYSITAVSRVIGP